MTIQRPMENIGEPLVCLVHASAGASDEFVPYFATKSLGITPETNRDTHWLSDWTFPNSDMSGYVTRVHIHLFFP